MMTSQASMSSRGSARAGGGVQNERCGRCRSHRHDLERHFKLGEDDVKEVEGLGIDSHRVVGPRRDDDGVFTVVINNNQRSAGGALVESNGVNVHTAAGELLFEPRPLGVAADCPEEGRGRAERGAGGSLVRTFAARKLRKIAAEYGLPRLRERPYADDEIDVGATDDAHRG